MFNSYRVLKYGGASIGTARLIINVLDQISKLLENKDYLLVFSAFPNVTRILKSLHEAYWLGEEKEMMRFFEEFKKVHEEILEGLFRNDAQCKAVAHFKKQAEELWKSLQSRPKDPLNDKERSKKYAQIVQYGELASSHIIHYCINEDERYQIAAGLVDARRIIKTNNMYEEAKVIHESTDKAVQEILIPAFEQDHIVVTQGFIATDEAGDVTTLGFDGSDLSAIVFGFFMNAESVTYWKDVPGVAFKDPKLYQDVGYWIYMPHKTYLDSGVTVVRPDAIELASKKFITVFVKCFLTPNGAYTTISKE